MTRALPVILISVLLIGGFIYAMGGQGEDADKPEAIPIDTSDRKRFPWKLEELYRPPTGWRFVARYATSDICHEKGRQHRQKTGRRFRCTRDG